MQEKLLRLLKCWPMMPSRISHEARTEVWVAISHTALEKDAMGGCARDLLPSQRMILSIPFLLIRAIETTWAYRGERDKTIAWPSETATSAMSTC